MSNNGVESPYEFVIVEEKSNTTLVVDYYTQKVEAKTAEDLMRSRYSTYVAKEIDYVVTLIIQTVEKNSKSR